MPLGSFVVDFCSEEIHLVVEIDGGQHSGSERDAARTKVLEAMGFLVLRFWNNEVLSNIDGVLETIVSTAKQHSSEPPHPDPLPTGEREKGASRRAASSLSHRERVPNEARQMRGKGASQLASEPPHPDPLPTGEREKSAASSLSHRERVAHVSAPGEGLQISTEQNPLTLTLSPQGRGNASE
jgi:hypothetical protein